MLQYGAVPVFVDITIPQYNIDVTRLEEALSERTKAVMIAHTLGNPFEPKIQRRVHQAAHLLLVKHPGGIGDPISRPETVGLLLICMIVGGDQIQNLPPRFLLPI